MRRWPAYPYGGLINTGLQDLNQITMGHRTWPGQHRFRLFWWRNRRRWDRGRPFLRPGPPPRGRSAAAQTWRSSWPTCCELRDNGQTSPICALCEFGLKIDTKNDTGRNVAGQASAANHSGACLSCPALIGWRGNQMHRGECCHLLNKFLHLLQPQDDALVHVWLAHTHPRISCFFARKALCEWN